MRRLLAVFVLGTVVPSVSMSGQLDDIPLIVDCLDGTQRDMAGPSDSTLAFPGDPTAQNARVVLAQGRRTIQHQVNNRERKFSEEDNFNTSLTAVELDEALGLLFALADDVGTHEPIPGGGQVTLPGELRVYDVSTPSAPLELHTLSHAPDLINIEDIRVIPEDSRLLVLNNDLATPLSALKTRLTVYKYGLDAFGAFFLTEESFVDLVDHPLAAPDCTHEAQGERMIRGLHRVVVQVDDAPFTRRAFVLASLNQPRAQKSKGAKAIIAVDLASWNATTLEPDYSSPTFYSDNGKHQIFDDYPCEDPPPIEPAIDWAPADLALIEDGANWFLAAVGGKEFQAKVFRVTGFDTSGFEYYVEKAFDFGGVTTDLQAVEASGTLLTIVGEHHQIAVDIHMLSSPQPMAEQFGVGPARDTLLMAEGPAEDPDLKLWCVTTAGSNPHRFKIMDFVTPPFPDATERRYAPGGTDAAIYIPEYDSVYATTFSGVVRYYEATTNPKAEYDTYSAALPNPSNPQIFKSIEHMVAAKRPSPLNEWHLFGSTAQGGFFQWRVDPTSKAPVAIGEIDGDSWTICDSPLCNPTYGQYVEYGINPLNGHEIVVVDYYNNVDGELEVAAYDLTTSQWGTPVKVTLQEHGIAPPLAELHLSEEWVFVGARKGFFAAKLDGSNNLTYVGVSKTITWEADPTGYGPGPVNGYSFLTVAGISRVKRLPGIAGNDRLIVSLDDQDAFGSPGSTVGGTNRFAVALFAFDPLTGWIGNDTVMPAVAGESMQALFDGAGTQPDDFPNTWIRGASKLRTYSWNNGTDVFCGTWNGQVLQLGYTQHNDTLATTSYKWGNGAFFDEISDCSIVNLASPTEVPDLRVTTPQWLETFAILAPVWQPNQ